MARFTFRVPEQFLRWCARSAASERPFRTMHLGDDPDLPLGPGWFDSSWDLEQGLVVREGPPADTKLLEWLDACVARRARIETAEVSAGLTIAAPVAFEFAASFTMPATVPTQPAIVSVSNR